MAKTVFFLSEGSMATLTKGRDTDGGVDWKCEGIVEAYLFFFFPMATVVFFLSEGSMATLTKGRDTDG